MRTYSIFASTAVASSLIAFGPEGLPSYSDLSASEKQAVDTIAANLGISVDDVIATGEYIAQANGETFDEALAEGVEQTSGVSDDELGDDEDEDDEALEEALEELIAEENDEDDDQ